MKNENEAIIEMKEENGVWRAMSREEIQQDQLNRRIAKILYYAHLFSFGGYVNPRRGYSVKDLF